MALNSRKGLLQKMSYFFAFWKLENETLGYPVNDNPDEDCLSAAPHSLAYLT